MEEKFTDIKDPVYQDAFELHPAQQKRLSLGDRVRWAMSILTGRSAGKQVPLACSTDGRLIAHIESGLVPNRFMSIDGQGKVLVKMSLTSNEVLGGGFGESLLASNPFLQNAPDGQAHSVVATTAEHNLDLGSAGARLLHVSASGDGFKVFDGAATATLTNPLGLVGGGNGIWVYSTLQWINSVNLDAGSAHIVVQSWDL